jgi:hypothetical protein
MCGRIKTAGHQPIPFTVEDREMGRKTMFARIVLVLPV